MLVTSFIRKIYMKPTRRFICDALPTYLRRDCHGQSDDAPTHTTDHSGWFCLSLDGFTIYDMMYEHKAIELADMLVDELPELQDRLEVFELLDSELTYLEDIPGMDDFLRMRIMEIYDSLDCV